MPGSGSGWALKLPSDPNKAGRIHERKRILSGEMEHFSYRALDLNYLCTENDTNKTHPSLCHISFDAQLLPPFEIPISWPWHSLTLLCQQGGAGQGRVEGAPGGRHGGHGEALEGVRGAHMGRGGALGLLLRGQERPLGLRQLRAGHGRGRWHRVRAGRVPDGLCNTQTHKHTHNNRVIPHCKGLRGHRDSAPPPGALLCRE